VVLHDQEGHPSLSTTHRGDQHLTIGTPQLLHRYEQATDIAHLNRLVIDREGMAAEFLFQLSASGRRVVTLLKVNQYEDEGSFTEVGEWVPWRADREGSVVCEVASARFQLTRPTQPDQPVTVQVALIRDWRKRIGGFAGPDAETGEGEQWKADLAPDQHQFWEPEWQATPAPPASSRPKLIPVVTTAVEANAVELAHTYFRRWNCQENAIRDWLIPLNLDTNQGYAKERDGELGTGQTTDSLGEARSSFAPPSGREPQTASSKAPVRPGARTASRDLLTTVAGLVGTNHGTGDHRPVP
jgi:hypothetical protein